MNADIFKISKPSDWVVVSEYEDKKPDESSYPYLYYLVDYQEFVESDQIRQYKRTVEKNQR